jgi:hypothetical protein
VAHVVKHALDQPGAFRARQAEPAVDDVGEIGTGQSPVDPCFPVKARDAKIGHIIFSRDRRLSPRHQLHVRNGTQTCRQRDNR